MERAALAGTFADFRLVRGRKVAQLVIEVPIEKANDALRALGGVPQPAEERWVAVARLGQKAAMEAPKPAKEHRRWSNLPLSQQAAIRCGEPGFQRFLNEKFGPFKDGHPWETETAFWVRQYCGVSSRAEIKEGTEAATLWDILESGFQEWKREPAFS